jgi:hypothetical protein
MHWFVIWTSHNRGVFVEAENNEHAVSLVRQHLAPGETLDMTQAANIRSMPSTSPRQND